MCNIGTNDVPNRIFGRIIESMMQPSSSGLPSLSLHAVHGRPLAMSLSRGERREWVRRNSVVRRIAAEFREMPGLVLTVPQASRFLGVDPAACERILIRLAKHGVLRRRAGGTYASA